MLLLIISILSTLSAFEAYGHAKSFEINFKAQPLYSSSTCSHETLLIKCCYPISMEMSNSGRGLEISSHLSLIEKIACHLKLHHLVVLREKSSLLTMHDSSPLAWIAMFYIPIPMLTESIS